MNRHICIDRRHIRDKGVARSDIGRTTPACKTKKAALAPSAALNSRRQSSKSTDDAHRPVIVAVPIVRMVQVAVDKIVHVVTVRNHLVSAVGTVNMPLVVSGALVIRRTFCRV